MYFKERVVGRRNSVVGRPTSYFRLLSTVSGFTFIEILMTLTIIAVLFIPVMQLFSNSLFSTTVNLETITAMNLAQSEMERTINLNLTKTQLKKIGTLVTPPENEKPLEMNGQFWRIKREIVDNSDPLEVRIVVTRDSEPAKSVVTLVTLVEDLMWDSVKTVSTA